MNQPQIINKLLGSDGSIAYVEFMEDGKIKLLSVQHFNNRYGSIVYSEGNKTTTSNEKYPDAELSLFAERTRKGA